MDRLTDVSDIVEKSPNIDGYEKKLLKKLFEKLENHQTNVFSRIESKVEKQLSELKEETSDWKIRTALVGNDNESLDYAKNNGFHEIIQLDRNREIMRCKELYAGAEYAKDRVSAGVVFLNCKYGEIVDYRNKTYYASAQANGRDFRLEYSLKPYFEIMNHEKRLEQIAFQYGIKTPPIYSPMSRRAMLILVNISKDFVNSNRDCTINFRFEENNLKDVLLTDKTLVWNIENEDNESLPRPKDNVDKRAAALFNKTQFIYYFHAKKNEYYFVQSDNTDFHRIGNTIYVGANQDFEKEDPKYYRYTINTYDANAPTNMTVFDNEFKNCCLKQRIRTKGDVSNALSCFNLGDFKIFASNNNFSFIKTYGKDCEYHYPKDDILRSSSVICIKIRDSGDLYFEDYVSYVLSYLNYHYPEFRWTGVY